MKCDEAASGRRRAVRGMVLGMAVMLGAGVGLTGCGGGDNPAARAWEDAAGLEVELLMEMPYGRAEGAEARAVHASAASAIGEVLARHPEAPGELRRALESLREKEERLANGEVSGTEAEALRRRQAEALMHLSERRLPPE